MIPGLNTHFIQCHISKGYKQYEHNLHKEQELPSLGKRIKNVLKIVKYSE